MIKKLFFMMSFIMLCIVICSCKDYSALNDKKIIRDRTLVENEWKFTLTVYYNNPSTLFDMPLELGQIRDGEYENSANHVFYERSFVQFLSALIIYRYVLSVNAECKIFAFIFVHQC